LSKRLRVGVSLSLSCRIGYLSLSLVYEVTSLRVRDSLSLLSKSVRV